MEFTRCAPASEYQQFDQILEMATTLIDEEDIVEAMAISIKEQFSNIREHSYHLDLTKSIYLSIRITEGLVVVVIIDAGKKWREDGYYTEPEAETKLLHLLEEGAERGRGHFIMSLLTHSLKYENGGRTRIMTWKRRNIYPSPATESFHLNTHDDQPLWSNLDRWSC